jgi:hypothetical protein
MSDTKTKYYTPKPRFNSLLGWNINRNRSEKKSANSGGIEPINLFSIKNNHQ